MSTYFFIAPYPSSIGAKILILPKILASVGTKILFQTFACI